MITHPSSPEDDDDNNSRANFSSPKSSPTGLKAKAADRARQALSGGARKLLRVANPPPSDPALHHLRDDAAFSPTRLARKLERHGAVEHGHRRDKLQAASDAVVTAVTNPRQAAKDVALKITASKISTVHQPHGLSGSGLELLDEKRLQEAVKDELNTDDHPSDEEGETPAARRKAKRDHREQLARDLEEQRDSMRAAWATSHTRRVRMVPKARIPFPVSSDFEVRNADGQVERFAWERWIGHLLIFYSQDFGAQYIEDFEDLSFDLDTLRTYGERILVASAPWQVWLMNVRAVYRWEDPFRTGRWFALYLILWYTEHILGFLWAFIIYYVLANRFNPSSVRHLQDSIARSKNGEVAALQLNELIERHGREDWLDPLIDALGPWVQLQLGDLANVLEILANFYAWKSSKRTAATLAFLGACLALAIFTDTQFCMNIFWFITGSYFFFCAPIGSRYPRYRLLVSPVKWVFWDIPTNTEWSFMHLRSQCQIGRINLIERRVEEIFQQEKEEPRLDYYTGSLAPAADGISSDAHDDSKQTSVQQSEATKCDGAGVQSDDDDDDFQSVSSGESLLNGTELIAFPAMLGARPGKLVIHASGVCFNSAPRNKEVWGVSFRDIDELRKFPGKKLDALDQDVAHCNDSAMAGGKNGKSSTQGADSLGLDTKRTLEIRTLNGETYTMVLMRDRDEAFNYIIGFAGVQWQSIPAATQRLRPAVLS